MYFIHCYLPRIDEDCSEERYTLSRAVWSVFAIFFLTFSRRYDQQMPVFFLVDTIYININEYLKSIDAYNTSI